VEGIAGLLPVLNEAGTIREVLEGIFSKGYLEQLLVVDDGSTDGTLQALGAMRLRWPIDVVVRHDERGLGSALLFGFREAVRRYSFERLVVLDADLSHDPASIPDLLSMRADLVLGSRYIEGGRIDNWTFLRRIISVGANSLARWLLRLPVQDVTSGFRVYSRSLVETILEQAACGGYEFQVETVWIAATQHYTIAEVPITFVGRKAGRSKLATPEEALKFARFMTTTAIFSRRRAAGKRPTSQTR